MRYLLFFIVIGTFLSCSHNAHRPAAGNYHLQFQTENGIIPARLEITENGLWHFRNAEEIIPVDSVVLKGDSFFVVLPLFDSSLRGVWSADSLRGTWTDHSRKAYTIPFRGVIKPKSSTSNSIENFTYNILFSPSDSAESSKGVGVLLKDGDIVTGTILTETGDYRYLEGEWRDDKIWLSAFDGTHLFYLSGHIKGDSISSGVFLSGKHWKEEWVAVQSNTHALRDPYSITTLRVDKNPAFSVLDNAGHSVSFDSTSWKNHVSIIQIMGSWCPNCTDESRFLKELHSTHGKQGLQIIPVAFERGDDIAAACRRVDNQFKQLGLPYSFYYGGKAGKEEAQKTLNFINEVHSFPTTIFIDKKGNIRRVFTGFYGPGTHQEYDLHTTEIKKLITELLQE